MKLTVLDSATLGDDLDLSVFEKFGKVDIYKSTNMENVEERITDTEVIIVNKIRLGKQNLDCAKKLKLICITATGFDNIDLDYCKERGIAVCNVVGYSTHSVAQVTLATALSLYTHLAEYKSYTDSGEYTKNKVQNHLKPVYNELYGKTWGIIGYGNIGKQVGIVAEAIGCRVMPYSRSIGNDLNEVLKSSDIISVHLPLNESTKNLINKEKISLIKKEAVFINVARGAVVDESALVQAVLDGKIGGLGVDVYSTEPFDENSAYNKILNRPDVCLTPHMAWGAYEARVRCIENICENIEAFFNGVRKNRLV